MELKFEWSEEKDRANYFKHGLSFDRAKTIWADKGALEFYDFPHSVAEDRFVRIGVSAEGEILTVVYCMRGQRVRLISARHATKNEKVIYARRL